MVGARLRRVRSPINPRITALLPCGRVGTACQPSLYLFSIVPLPFAYGEQCLPIPHPLPAIPSHPYPLPPRITPSLESVGLRAGA